MTLNIAKKAKAKRLSLSWSQKTLSIRSGVRCGTLKKFEQTGQISLESLLKIAFTKKWRKTPTEKKSIQRSQTLLKKISNGSFSITRGNTSSDSSASNEY